MSLVVQLTEVGRDDIATAGGKGANLGELIRAGAHVPPGFVVTSGAYTHFLESTGMRPRLGELAATLSDTSTIDSTAAEIQALVESNELPEDLKAAISEAYEALGGGRVAVRSSATAEDLPDASFAGQQSTFLNVEGEEAVYEAVKGCWASLFEPRAVHYRERSNYDHAGVSIAVVVQRMVDAERSGVMFTTNPITGDKESIVIEAIFGLGEAVVSGVVTPDMFVVEKASRTVADRQVAGQQQELVRNPDAGPGDEPNQWLPVPFDRRARPKLDDNQISELAIAGIRIEEHFGPPQDIEWAYADGTFYIVQARPITSTVS